MSKKENWEGPEIVRSIYPGSGNFWTSHFRGDIVIRKSNEDTLKEAREAAMESARKIMALVAESKELDKLQVGAGVLGAAKAWHLLNDEIMTQIKEEVETVTEYLELKEELKEDADR